MTLVGGSGSLSESSSWSLPKSPSSVAWSSKGVDWSKFRRTEKLVQVLASIVLANVSQRAINRVSRGLRVCRCLGEIRRAFSDL